MRILSIAVICALSVAVLASWFETEGGFIDDTPELIFPEIDNEVRIEDIMYSEFDGSHFTRSRHDSSWELGSTLSLKACVCKKVYKPFCCKTTSGFTNTNNQCECLCKNKGDIKLSYPGTCKAKCICTKEYKPTCCKTPKGALTASNPCICKCNGTPIHSGSCKKRKYCKCHSSYKPVCCLRGRRKWMARNKCVCGCHDGISLPAVMCRSSSKCRRCSKIFKPVCCKTRRGYIMTVNRCLCYCWGRRNRIVHKRRCFLRKYWVGEDIVRTKFCNTQNYKKPV